MKKIILPVLVLFLGVLSTSCGEGLSVSEYCEKALECNPNAYTSQQVCQSEVQNDTNLATEACIDYINAYYECVLEGICNGNANAKSTCSRDELNSCKAGLAN